MDAHRVAAVSDINAGEMKSVMAGTVRVVLFCHADGSYSALEDRCSHAEVKLSRGKFCDGEVTCPAHGARFDSRTGKNLCMPAILPVRSFTVEARAGELFVLM